MIRALHIALKNPSTSFIAVIDLHLAANKGAAREENSDRISNVHWVPSLNLETTHPYHGRSEYLVWGSIERPAIMSTVSFFSLLARLSHTPEHLSPFRFDIIQKFKASRSVRSRISKHRPARTYETGVAVGTFAIALDLSVLHLPFFVELVATEWSFKASTEKDDQRFMDGVTEGFERSFEETEPRAFEHFVESLRNFLDATKHPGTLAPAAEAISHQDPVVEGVDAGADYPRIKLEDDMEDEMGEDMVDEVNDMGDDMDVEQSIPDKAYDMDWTNIKPEHDGEIPQHNIPASKVPRVGQWKEIGGYGPWTLRLYDTGMPAGRNMS